MVFGLGAWLQVGGDAGWCMELEAHLSEVVYVKSNVVSKSQVAAENQVCKRVRGANAPS